MAFTPISRTRKTIRTIVNAANTRHRRRKSRSIQRWAEVGGCQIWPACQAATSSRAFLMRIFPEPMPRDTHPPVHHRAILLQGLDCRLRLGNNRVRQRHVPESFRFLLAVGQAVGNQGLEGLKLILVVVLLVEN